jgi:peptidoglycan/xylan/chitin deacetylase (PgdA/CDA1 family)
MYSLAKRGFVGISLSDLLDGWDGLAKLPARPVVLTFDDGFANFVEHAAPVLSELGFRATIFAVSGRCGRTNDWPHQAPAIPRLPLLSWSQLAEMVTAGFEIGAHSVTHRPLTEITPAEAEREIVESKERIEEELGRPVKTFAYPFGMFTRTHCEIVRKHFRGACSVKLGKAKRESDRHQLPRLDIYYLRRPVLFQLFETLPGKAYLALRGAGRSIRAELVRCGLLSQNKTAREHTDAHC